MKKTIFLKDVLDEMKKLDDRKNPIPFSVKVRSFSVQNKTGGQYKILSFCDFITSPKSKGR